MIEQTQLEEKINEFVNNYLYTEVTNEQLEQCNIADLSLLCHLAAATDVISDTKRRQLLIACTKQLSKESFLIAFDQNTNNYYKDDEGRLYIFTSDDTYENFASDKSQSDRELTPVLMNVENYYNFTVYASAHMYKGFIINESTARCVVPMEDVFLANYLTAKQEYQFCNPTFDNYLELLMKAAGDDFLENKCYNIMMLSLANSEVLLPVRTNIKEGLLTSKDANSESYKVDEYFDGSEKAYPIFTNAWNMDVEFSLDKYRPLVIKLSDMLDIADYEDCKLIINPGTNKFTIVEIDRERIDYYTNVKNATESYFKKLKIKESEWMSYLVSFELMGALELFAEIVEKDFIPKNDISFEGVTLSDLVDSFNFTYLAAFNFFALAQKNPESAKEFLMNHPKQKNVSK